MTSNDAWRRYLEVGAAVGELALSRAEGVTNRLLSSKSEEREGAWRDLDHLARLGMRLGEQALDVALSELDRQITSPKDHSFDRLVTRVAEIFGVQSPTPPAEHPSEPPVPAMEHLDEFPDIDLSVEAPDPEGERIPRTKKPSNKQAKEHNGSKSGKKKRGS